MSEAAAGAWIDSVFLRELTKLTRAQSARSDGQPDATVVAPYILTRKKRRAIPLIGNPSPAVIARLEAFYMAIGFAIERTTGTMVTPIVQLSNEGFGRVVVTAGRLIVLNRYHRDVHRFGFGSLQALADAGDERSEEAAQMIGRFPEVAAYRAA